MNDGVIGAAPTSDCVNWSFLLSEVTRAVGAAPTWKWCVNSSLFLSELLAIDTVFIGLLKTAYAGLLFDSVLMLLPVPLQFAGAVKTKYLSALKREVSPMYLKAGIISGYLI